MGLFDKAKQAFGAGQPAAGGADWAAQAQAAQAMADQAMKDAGYTDATPVTPANAGAVSDQMAADHAVLNAYGQELNRIIAIGTRGSSVITSLVATGEQTAGNHWYQVVVDVTLPGQEPYSVSSRQMVPAQFLANYAEGTTHDIAVDPLNPQAIALTS